MKCKIAWIFWIHMHLIHLLIGTMPFTVHPIAKGSLVAVDDQHLQARPSQTDSSAKPREAAEFLNLKWGRWEVASGSK